jgi:hypothetical protein
MKRALGLLILGGIALAPQPSIAGTWVNGGTFDFQRNVGISFLRLLWEPGEAQMTIRCDPLDGLWVDAGVDGDGARPGDPTVATVTLTFSAAGVPTEIVAEGPVVIRGDGAVLVSIAGPAAAPLGPAFLAPFDALTVTIGDVTLPVPVDGLGERLTTLANRCPGWPR